MQQAEEQLPPDVLRALHAGHRVRAIGLLRAHSAIGAKEAEARIDRYLEDNPPIPLRGPGIVASSRLNALVWVALIVLMGLAYLLLAS
ncbi:hypothetical protein LPB260_25590 [Pseudomonas sp. LPB0260]|uniref:hypothetical protein n=1 Tax=Pseudomonas sp. LPB0260 TaxID=2614442 RepID=UPI0015C245EE|nr:hypothetical protein [Pseudomonas sp. LPB0260]QLC74075.1 hypothetical protein LPB260_10640 [Pseudomonas sp. LPB0260]QLC76847.1 hypothetical protein LPB260_25590 [Pseudomonas sp. LPB0260]